MFRTTSRIEPEQVDLSRPQGRRPAVEHLAAFVEDRSKLSPGELSQLRDCHSLRHRNMIPFSPHCPIAAIRQTLG